MAVYRRSKLTRAEYQMIWSAFRLGLLLLVPDAYRPLSISSSKYFYEILCSIVWIHRQPVQRLGRCLILDRLAEVLYNALMFRLLPESFVSYLLAPFHHVS